MSNVQAANANGAPFRYSVVCVAMGLAAQYYVAALPVGGMNEDLT
jgi:hypothetical protein